MTEPSAPQPTDIPIRRFFGAALMAVGGLIALLCGLCTLGWTGFVIFGMATSHDTSAASIIGGTLMITLFVGVVPTALGVALFIAGRNLRRPNPPQTGTPPPPP
jgi:hypothetical protein